MPRGIHVEVAIEHPPSCQVSPHSEGEMAVTAVSKIPHPDEDGTVVEEFTRATNPNGIEPDGGTTIEDDSVEELFVNGPKEIFRFRRQAPQPCVCERIEAFGCPVRDVNAVDGTLYVTFLATDHDRLQSVLERLTEVYDDMSVCRLLQSQCGDDTEQPVLVDIGALTERQREVLKRAHRMGYFDHPKSASAADVAAELDIAPATFTEHLAAAQRNLFEELLDR